MKDEAKAMTNDQTVTQADKDLTAEILGCQDWDDATDYRNSGEHDRKRDRILALVARHRTAHSGEGRSNGTGEVHCRKCGQCCSGLPGNRDAAAAELRSFGWETRHGLWICVHCTFTTPRGTRFALAQPEAGGE